MIVKLLFALILSNILGVVFDLLEGQQNFALRKNYTRSAIGIFLMLFFRNIIFILKGLFSFRRKEFADSIAIIIFITITYFLLNIDGETGELFKVWAAFTFILWSITYAYISVTSTFFYLEADPIKLSERELKFRDYKASFKDKIILFIQNVFSSVFAPPIYGLSIISTLTLFVIHKFI